MDYEDKILSHEKEIAFICEIFEEKFDLILQKGLEDLFPIADENNYMLNPEQFPEVIKEEVRNFINFLKTRQLKQVKEKAKKVIKKGLALTVFQKICGVFRSSLDEYYIEHDTKRLILSSDLVSLYNDTYFSVYCRVDIEYMQLELEKFHNFLLKIQEYRYEKSRMN